MKKMIIYSLLTLILISSVSACYKPPIKNYYSNSYSSGGSIGTERLSEYLTGDRLFWTNITTTGYNNFTPNNLDPININTKQERFSFFGWINTWYASKIEVAELRARIEVLENGN